MIIVNSEILLTKEEIENAINNTSSMGAAANVLKLDQRTFKKEAEKYGLYKPAKSSVHRFELEDILAGKHPHYSGTHLSKRLVKTGYLRYQCNSCKITEYNGKAIILDLNHIDGDNTNHSLSNLELLCPNCHSQTINYGKKNHKFRKMIRESSRD